MRVYVGADHAGFELKAHLVGALMAKGYDVVDVGAQRYDAEDDYPGFCIDAATRVVAEPGSLGVVIGGSGNGEQIAATKVAVGARQHSNHEAAEIVLAFLSTPFSDEERHARRIQQIADFEYAQKSATQ